MSDKPTKLSAYLGAADRARFYRVAAGFAAVGLSLLDAASAIESAASDNGAAPGQFSAACQRFRTELRHGEDLTKAVAAGFGAPGIAEGALLRAWSPKHSAEQKSALLRLIAEAVAADER